VIDFSNSPQAAHTLPQPQPETPQTICNDDEHNGFRKLQQAAHDRGLPVYE
jgi:hypothetical protein